MLLAVTNPKPLLVPMLIPMPELFNPDFNQHCLLEVSYAMPEQPRVASH